MAEDTHPNAEQVLLRLLHDTSPARKSVRDACQLQPNALSIKLSDQVEQLDELIHAAGEGAAFFGKTHITQGMQDLVTEGIARLAGVSSQAVFHLKQAMGGGKTHLLVGFGLLAKHPALRRKYCGGEANAQMFEAARVAAFNGRNSPAHCFWGEIVRQLGKPEVFQEFWAPGPKAPDEKAWLNLFNGKAPILILPDEMPPYFEELATRPVGAGTVADIATRAFANLLTAASTEPKLRRRFRLTYRPTKTMVRCEAELSMQQNKETGLRLRKAKLWRLFRARNNPALGMMAQIQQRHRSCQSALRKCQTGSGMRGDKRRTVRVQHGVVEDDVTGRNRGYSDSRSGNQQKVSVYHRMSG